MKWSQRGPVSVVPVIFPHSVTPSQLLLTKNSNCSGWSLVLFWLSLWLLWGPVPSLLQFLSLTEWWRVIVQSEKAKAVRVFSSLISQVQSCRLGTTYGVKRNDHWWRKRATGGPFKKWQQVRGYKTTSSSRPCSHSVMLLGWCTDIY